MAVFRDNRGEVGALYTEEQVENILNSIGIDVTTNDGEWLRCFCPFHNNNDSPAMGVRIDYGSYHCFNPSCDQRGDLITLVEKMTGKNRFESIRFVRKARTAEVDLNLKLQKIFANDRGLKRYDKIDFDAMNAAYWQSDEAKTYMTGRGFVGETINRFKIGWSERNHSIMVPCHDHTGMPVGFVARDARAKNFHISKGLIKNDFVFNLNRARRTGATHLILTEASFDTARVDQAGFQNVGALLGGSISDTQASLIKKHFRGVIIMTDNDDPYRYDENCKRCPRRGFKVCMGHNAGREIARSIQQKLAGMPIKWASYEERMIYPHGAKDVGDMTDQEIVQCIDNAVSTFQYNLWQLHPKVDMWYN